MKRFLCLFIFILLCIAVFVPAAAADSDTLTITDSGKVLAEVKVGSVFLYRVGLFTGQHTLINGEGEIRYDKSLLQPLAYGDPTPEGYSFEGRLADASAVVNITDVPGTVYYNFSQVTGIEGYGSTDEPYLRLRFKVLAGGTTELNHLMQTLTARDNKNTFYKLFQNGKASDRYDKLPYTVGSVELPCAYIGDANNDGGISLIDATLIQWITAGRRLSYSKPNADTNGDGDINLKDALAVRRYAAGMNAANVGDYRFASE